MLSIEGDDIERVDKAMQHLSYLNSRQFPTPGIRRLKITSTVRCVLLLSWSIPVQGWGSLVGMDLPWEKQRSPGLCDHHTFQY